jgi:hypothetical protein
MSFLLIATIVEAASLAVNASSSSSDDSSPANQRWIVKIRKHKRFTAQSVCNRCTIVAQSVRNQSAHAAQSLRNYSNASQLLQRFEITLQLHCNRRAIDHNLRVVDSQSQRNHSAITAQSLLNRCTMGKNSKRNR